MLLVVLTIRGMPVFQFSSFPLIPFVPKIQAEYYIDNFLQNINSMLFISNIKKNSKFQMGTDQSTRTLEWSDAGYNMWSRVPSKSSQPFDSLEK